MSRSPRSTVLRLAAALVAVATSLAVASDLAALHRRARDLGPARDVVVAGRDLPVGTRIDRDDLDTVRRHASQVPDDALAAPDDATGKTVALGVPVGSALRPAHLGDGAGPGPAALVRPGYRLVRVRSDDGYAPALGTVVDVLVSVEAGLAGAAGPESTAVVAAGAVVVERDRGDDGGFAEPAVLLLVRERDAERLAFARAHGVLTLAVAPPEDACCRTSSWGSSRD